MNMCSHSPIPESTISDPLKQFLSTLIEAMVLPLHLSNNESSTHQSCTVIEDESCLAEVTRFSARRGYSSAIIGDNGTIFVGAANKLRAFLTQRDKAKIESEFAKKKERLENQSTWRSPLWWNLQENSSKLQEGYECNPGQRQLR